MCILARSLIRSTLLIGDIYLISGLIKFLDVNVAGTSAPRFHDFSTLLDVLNVSIDIASFWKSASKRLSCTENITSALDLVVASILRCDILLRRLPGFMSRLLVSLSLIGREHPKADVSATLVQIGNTTLDLLPRTV